jgi:hypothetical protein
MSDDALQQAQELAAELERDARLIALHIRNELEDFHVKHLTDEQMRELNPIIRNAVLDGLVMFLGTAEGEGPLATKNAQFMGWLSLMMPEYWEPAELSDEYRAWLSSDRSDTSKQSDRDG